MTAPRAIILAAFGTAEPSAIPSLLAVRRRVAEAFPGDAVTLAFTSPTVRKIWHGGADSWLARFRAAGFAVECHLEGLGSNPSWADIYVEHVRALLCA